MVRGARRLSRVALAAGLWLAATQTTALAGEPTTDQKSGARAAATEGNHAFEAKKYSEALDYFKRAESLMHAPTHVLMIARTQTELRQLVAARESYNLLVREQLAANAPPAFKEAQQQAKTELAALEPRIPTVELEVPEPKPADLTVTMDGVAVAPELIGIARPVDPGRHVFHGESSALVADDKSLDVTEGAHLSVMLELRARPGGPKPKAPALPPKPGDETSTSPSPLAIVGWVGLGVGVAGLGVGAAFTGLGFSKRGEADDAYAACGSEACIEGSPQALAVNELDDDANTKQTIGLIGLVAGGALAATGATLLVVSMGSTSDEATTAITPLIGPGFIGVRGLF